MKNIYDEVKDALEKIWKDTFPKSCETWSANKLYEHWSMVEKALKRAKKVEELLWLYKENSEYVKCQSFREMSIHKMWAINSYDEEEKYEANLKKIERLEKELEEMK